LRVPEWFRDRTVRRIAKFGVPVALGKFLTAGSGLITLAILARYLGPKPLGVIALFRTVVTTVDLFANCNTWQAIIKYGAEAIAGDRRDDVKRVIKLAFVIDVSTAIIGALVVVGLAFAIPGSFGWSPHQSVLCAMYAFTLVSKASGTSDGIYRICDAYRVQAIATSIMAGVSTMLVAIAVFTGAAFDGCVLALVAGEVASNLVVTACAFWVARNSGFGGWQRGVLGGIAQAFPGITRFLVTTNAQLTVRTAQSELDMLVVGSVLGQTSAGLFRVVKQLGTIPGRVFLPFEQVLFTELARSAATRDYAGFRRLLGRTVRIAGLGSLLLWVVAALLAPQLIRLVAGPAFLDAVDPFRWYLFAMIVQVTGTPILRAMIALGKPGTLLMFEIVALGILVVSMVIGVRFGLPGVAAALIIHKSFQLTWSTIFVWRYVHRAEVETNAQLPISTTNK
jgi:O-antigen/teichoic acid export membrane protein